MNNDRNSFGVKYSCDCYLTIKGKVFKQWSDASPTREDAIKMIAESPKENDYIIRKQKEGYYRIYYREP